MKYLIVGLGNPGMEYAGTRHNIGFEVLDHMAGEKTFKQVNHGVMCTIRMKGRSLVLLKPSTYVNRSGKAVRYWLQKQNIKQDHLLVIVDDMNLDFGRIRLREKGSDGGHNGLKDINQCIGTNYPRLRLGIGNAPKGQHVDFVLGKWNPEEKRQLPGIIEDAAEVVTGFVSIGIGRAMSQYNR